MLADNRILHALALTAALAAAAPATALDFVWQGGAGDWTDANWGRPASPIWPSGTTHDVFIDGGDAGASLVTLGILSFVRSVTIDTGDRLDVANGGSLFLDTSLANNGILNLGAAGGASFLYFSTAATLGGSGGQTRIAAGSGNGISSLNQLTIGAGHTVSGGGTVNVGSIVNLGTVAATAATGLGISTTQAATFSNTGGTVTVADGSFVDFGFSQLSGGVLRGSGSAQFRGAGVLRDLTLEGRLAIGNGSSATVGGTITNNGLLTVASAGQDTLLMLQAAATLTGSGETVVGGGAGNTLVTSLSPGASLTLQAHTLRGSGALANIKLINRGTLRAEGAGGLSLFLTDGVDSLRNDGGVIEVADGSFVGMGFGTASGGVLRGSGTASVWGGVWRDVALEGTLTVADGKNLTVAGSITNNGSLTLDDRGNTSTLLVQGQVTLAGSGRTVMQSTRAGAIGTSILPSNLQPGSGLTIAAGHTLDGGGLIAMGRFVNEGTVVVRHPAGMRFDGFEAGAELLNRGRIRIEAGNRMSVQRSTPPDDLGGNPHTLRQDAAGASIELFGSLDVSQLLLDAGVLRGTGSITGDVVNSGGTIIVGASPGKLSIDGTLTLGPGSVLQMDVDGAIAGIGYDWLAVSGDVLLGGVLQLSFGAVPAPGASFQLLSSDSGSISGRFDTVLADGMTVVVDYGQQGVSITATPVPEPGTGVLLLLGGALLLARRRRLLAGWPLRPSPA